MTKTNTYTQHAKQKPHTYKVIENMKKKLISMYLKSNRLSEKEYKREKVRARQRELSMIEKKIRFVRTTTFMKHKTKNSKLCSKKNKT